jgi:hypothetical protein
MPPLSLRIGLAAAWFASCGIYSEWVAFEYHNWFAGIIGVLELIGAAGVVARCRWSKWLVYGLAVVIVGSWIYGLALSIKLGAFPYETLRLTVLGLVPGFVIVAATTWSADTVRRCFRGVVEPA